jgi:plastocyanin
MIPQGPRTRRFEEATPPGLAATLVLPLLPLLPLLLAAAPASVGAGTIRGQVELSAAAAPPPGAARAANPYPGRANALPRAGTGTGTGGGAAAVRGGAGETVIVVAKLPPGLEVVPPPAGARPALEQKQQAFAPRVLAIQAGTTVEFPNRDPVYHNVFSVSPARRFDLGKYAQGQSRRVRFDKAGIVNVYCDIHSDMAAWIYVAPHHVFAQANAAGRFALPELPAGRYVLEAWHPDRGERTVEVDVPADGDVAVTVRY